MRTIILTALAVIVIAGSAMALKRYVIDRPTGNPYVSALQTGFKGGSMPGPGGCGGKCCSTPAIDPSTAKPADLDETKRLALEYYKANYGDVAVTAEVKDMGCHQEARIYKDGSVVKRLAIQAGRIFEMG